MFDSVTRDTLLRTISFDDNVYHVCPKKTLLRFPGKWDKISGDEKPGLSLISLLACIVKKPNWCRFPENA
jgi:hypothetical protein